MKQAIKKAAVLIEALPYIQAFKGTVVLVKVGGSVMEVPCNLNSLLKDIAFMNAVGMKVVLVHGGGKAISRGMLNAGIEAEFVHGLRVTDDKSIRVVESVIKDEVNSNVIRILKNSGAVAESVHGDEIFTVRKKTGTCPESGVELDWGYVGMPVEVNTSKIFEMIDGGVIPVVTPLGCCPDGKLYNINADVAAAALAKAMKVNKLAFVSDVPGLLMDVHDHATLLNSLRISSIQKLKENGVIAGGMLPKVDSCVEAIEAGVGKVHLVDGRMSHSLLLEIFTKQGVGTEIIADE
ncbi:MAG: acetylglutamate kinase [Kiritimatiellia bacterium]